MRKNLTVLFLVLGFLASGAVVAGQASATLIDGLNVTFNSLPTSIVTTELAPNSLTGANVFFSGVGGLSNGLSWGQTNPFEYSTTLKDEGSTLGIPWVNVNGTWYQPISNPIYDAIWKGSAIYDYASTQNSFSILWGTVDDSNALSLYKGNTLIGTIIGADLKAAITAAGLGAGQLYTNGNGLHTVDLTISVPTGFTQATTTGGPTLTFEYSNIVTADPVPLPATLLLFGPGLAGLAAIRRRFKK